MKNTQNIISLAPFRGLTDKFFRNLFLDSFGGIDRAYAPFVSGCGIKQISKSKLEDLLENDKPLPKTIPQILSNDSREIALFGKTLVDYGYSHINWNLGCPFSRIANKEKGCGLLPHPEKIRDILDYFFYYHKSTINLSIKVRLGYHHKDEILKIIEIFNQYPVYEIIIHPRIGKQLYKGEVYLGSFEKCMKKSRHKVAYNGDIYNKETFKELKTKFSQTNHWMIGRGLLINPFLGEQIKNVNISDEKKRERLHKFVNQLCIITENRIGNKRRTLNYMKAVMFYLSGSFKDAGMVFSRIKITQTPEEFKDVFDEIISYKLSCDREIKSHFKNGLKHI